ncbi:ShKT domain-containing protein [Meloidogyne graminicola]|uniref:ShKT domain-containing protein n=1 Tax=Meloidogyne graminicola TaxID=189291 RepID=A0A8S9ZWC7_9BILA|nr:ShKT domain-containing protein [Meloidogyne graminicola]
MLLNNLINIIYFLLILIKIINSQYCLNNEYKEEVCENHLPIDVCLTIFGSRKNNEKRPKLCENSYLQNEALLCAKHCYQCCERQEHSCPDLRKNCFKRRRDGICWENIEEKINECPGTCGLCGRKKWKWNENWMCKDTNWECSDMESFCLFDERVRLLCPKTCQKFWSIDIGFEKPCELERKLYEFRFEKPPEEEDCTDTRNDCFNDIFFCEMPNYFYKLKDECPKTCAHCKPKGHKCFDKNNKKCIEWQSHKHRPFCYNHKNTKGIKFHYCAKTCNLC